MTIPARLGTTAPREIGLANATYLEMGLEALQDNNMPRAVGALASIDANAWAIITERFPELPSLIAGGAR